MSTFISRPGIVDLSKLDVTLIHDCSIDPPTSTVLVNDQVVLLKQDHLFTTNDLARLLAALDVSFRFHDLR